MKNSQRLDFNTLAEVLGERNLIEPKKLQAALQLSARGSGTLPEVLVNDNLITEWELASIVCELYGLPFLPVEMYAPSNRALVDLDMEFLRFNNLVPFERFGRVLTVCMPVLVSAEVLGVFSAQTNLRVVPIVGTVRGNQRWWEDNLHNLSQPSASGKNVFAAGDDGEWSSIFDEGDANVDAAVHLKTEDAEA